MVNLQYIVIGKLPGKEKEDLVSNLKEGNIKQKEIVLIELEEKNNFYEGISKIKGLESEHSLLVSGDGKELEAAVELGMATVAYLVSQNAKELTKPETDTPREKQTLHPTKADTSESQETSEQMEADIYVEGFEEIGLTFLLRTYERHHGIPWTILETERCIVKEFSMDDLDGLFELYAGEGMTDYLEPLYSYEKEKEYQEAYIQYMYGFYGYGLWMVYRKTDGKLIGRIGVEHREELGGEIELGYLIGVPYQRQGYAKEVCTAVISYVQEEFFFEKLNCLIEEGNTVSEILARKMGFSYQETLQLDEKIMKRYVYYGKNIVENRRER